MRRGVLTALAILAFAAPAQGQGGGPGNRGRLDVTLTTTAVAFPVPGVVDFDAGYIDHAGYLVSIQSRPAGEAWELRIRADDPNMGGYGKPVADVLWRTSTSPVWSPLTGTDQTVTQGAGDADVTILFRVRLDWAADLPDTYAAGISFTAVRP